MLSYTSNANYQWREQDSFDDGLTRPRIEFNKNLSHESGMNIPNELLK